MKGSLPVRLSASRCLVLTLLVCRAAAADFYPAPQVSTPVDGDYTVTYVPGCGSVPSGYACAFAYLQEKTDLTAYWVNVSSGTGLVAFSGRAPGTYSYRMHVGGYDPYFNYIEGYSSTVTVVVGQGGSRDDLVTQMSYEYSVRQGDLDGNGRTDFLVSRVAGGEPSNGTIDKVILQQSPGGTFSAVVPSPWQASVAATWPVSGVEPVVGDVNVDGFVDVTLSGVASAVPGAFDQIVFSSGQPTVAAPLGVRAFDTELGRFVSNTMDYFADPDYFTDNAPSYYVQLWIWYVWCGPWGVGLDDPYWSYFSGCYIDYVYLSGVYQDFSGFDEAALAFWINDSDALNGYIDEDRALDDAEAAVESKLGTPIGGWPMEEILGPVGEHTDPFVRRGIEIGQSVLGQARGGRNATTSDLIPPQEARLPDQIYITGHPLVFARSRGHLALEYVDSLGGGIPYTGRTLSAGPENNNFFNFGKLIAEDDRPTDHPLFNFKIGDVDPLYTSNWLYWTNYLKRRHDNYRNLPYNGLVDYALVPSASAGTSNSNGYIRGVTQDSPGNVTITVPFGIGSRYPGWNEPVPNQKFN